MPFHALSFCTEGTGAALTSVTKAGGFYEPDFVPSVAIKIKSDKVSDPSHVSTTDVPELRLSHVRERELKVCVSRLHMFTAV